MKKLKVTKLHGTFLAMNLLPIILMGLVITIFSANRFAASMYHEVQGGLKDLCNTIQVTIDELVSRSISCGRNGRCNLFYEGRACP